MARRPLAGSGGRDPGAERRRVRGGADRAAQARAVLPADTTAPGPESGAALGPGPINGFAVPFATQPVQGAGILPAGRASGGRCPTTATGWSAPPTGCCASTACGPSSTAGGAGGATVEGFVRSAIRTASSRTRSSAPTGLLTGADVDPESILKARDGTFWIGDEFGPGCSTSTNRGACSMRRSRSRRAVAAESDPGRRARPWIAARVRGRRAVADRQAGVRLPGGRAARRPRPAPAIRLRARPRLRPVHGPPLGLPDRGPGLVGRRREGARRPPPAGHGARRLRGDRGRLQARLRGRAVGRGRARRALRRQVRRQARTRRLARAAQPRRRRRRRSRATAAWATRSRSCSAASRTSCRSIAGACWSPTTRRHTPFDARRPDGRGRRKRVDRGPPDRAAREDHRRAAAPRANGSSWPTSSSATPPPRGRDRQARGRTLRPGRTRARAGDGELDLRAPASRANTSSAWKRGWATPPTPPAPNWSCAAGDQWLIRPKREERDRGEVSRGGGDDQRVEDLVVAEYRWARDQALRGVDDRPGGIEGAAGRDQEPGWSGLGDDRREPDGADQSDGDVDDRRDPLRRLDPDDLDHRAASAPAERQSAARSPAGRPSPTGRWRHGAGDQQEDHRVSRRRIQRRTAGRSHAPGDRRADRRTAPRG